MLQCNFTESFAHNKYLNLTFCDETFAIYPNDFSEQINLIDMIKNIF